MINYNLANEYIEKLIKLGVTPDAIKTATEAETPHLYRHTISIKNTHTKGFVSFDILNTNATPYTTLEQVKTAMGTNKFTASGADYTLGDVYSYINQVYVDNNLIKAVGSTIIPDALNYENVDYYTYNGNDTLSLMDESTNFIDDELNVTINDDVNQLL